MRCEVSVSSWDEALSDTIPLGRETSAFLECWCLMFMCDPDPDPRDDMDKKPDAIAQVMKMMHACIQYIVYTFIFV